MTRALIQNLTLVELGLLLPQAALIFLSIYRAFSLHYTAPIIIILSASWGWFNYVGKSQQRVRDVLVELEELLDGFGRVNFQQGKHDDQRIIKLLDNASFGSSRTITPDLASKTSEKIMEQYKTLQLWYFSLLHKVRVMVRRAGNLIEYDIIDAANDYVDLYNSYIEAVAEETLSLVNQGELRDLSNARQILKTFTINMSEIRGRGNTLLKKMRQQGYTVSGLDLKPFSQDIAFEEDTGTGMPQEDQGTSRVKA
jgi:hypothetical protein